MLVIMFGLGVVRVVMVFLLFVVVLFLIVVGCGCKDVYFGHCGALVNTVGVLQAWRSCVSTRLLLQPGFNSGLMSYMC